MAELALTGKRGAGKVMVCDDADLAQLAAHRWHLSHSGYPRTYLRRADGKSTTIEAHLLLTDEQGGRYRDHINGDPLDNRRANLRPCTQQENSFNRRRHKNNRSGFKGVSPYKGSKHKWRAVIHRDGRQVYLGVFPHPVLAAIAYNAAATVLHGPFALVNPIPALHFEVAHAAD